MKPGEGFEEWKGYSIGREQQKERHGGIRERWV